MELINSLPPLLHSKWSWILVGFIILNFFTKFWPIRIIFKIFKIVIGFGKFAVTILIILIIILISFNFGAFFMLKKTWQLSERTTIAELEVIKEVHPNNADNEFFIDIIFFGKDTTEKYVKLIGGDQFRISGMIFKPNPRIQLLLSKKNGETIFFRLDRFDTRYKKADDENKKKGTAVTINPLNKINSFIKKFKRFLFIGDLYGNGVYTSEPGKWLLQVSISGFELKRK